MKLIEYTCVMCGKTYIPKKSKQKCCSSECGIEYTKRHYTKRNIEECTCGYCGKKFKLTRTGLKGLYCSHECHTKQMAKDKIIRDDIKNKEKQRQKELRELKAKNRKLANEYIKSLSKWKILDCKECGREYFTTGQNKTFCSRECSNRYSWRVHDNKKRYTKNGKADYSITLQKLYKRDKGVCKMCNRKLSFDCHYNSNDYPSIDHIQPIAKGGLHTWDNVQLLCRGCNTFKSDKIPRPPF